MEDSNQVKYLPLVVTAGLLDKVQAAIYLSLDELWAVSALIATFLDPRFKHFNWSTSEERNRAHQLVKALYEELKVDFCIPNNVEDRNRENNENNGNNKKIS